MNGVNELNEIIGAAIEVHRTLYKKGIQRLVHELPEQSLRSPRARR